jgi:hypothetical protein
MAPEVMRNLSLAGLLLAMVACAGPTIVENSATSVTVRYGAADTEEAGELAQRACAAHHKTARLRNTANFGLSERYGHFDCV